MKYRYLLLFYPLLFTACTKVRYVQFTGDMPGINNGIFEIKDKARTPIFSQSIFSGRFDVKHILQQPGYYDLYLTEDESKDYKKHVYDVYLEEGAYTINAKAGKLYEYPNIKSTSVIQSQLSDYYTLADEKMHAAQVEVDTLNHVLYGKNGPVVNSEAYSNIQTKLDDAMKTLDNIEAKAFEEYVDTHPQNQVEAHILSEIDYKKDPEDYYRIFKKFTADQKNSSDGRDEGDDLKHLTALSPGALAPKLIGKTPDGKAFDPKTVNKKVIIVEFWRSDNQVSINNHQDLLNEFDSPLKNNDVTMVSVSLDTKPDVWAAAIKDLKASWTQISDLKGEDSPNMTSWGASTIPTYDLVDGNWHFIKRDVDFNQLGLEIDDYLKKAH
jgi:hypothetical protein